MSGNRNDSVLLGGVQSPARRKELAEKKEAPPKLDAKAERVLDLIAAEKLRVSHINAVRLGVEVSDADALLDIRLQSMQYDYLKRLETQMKRILGMATAEPEAKS